jgi:hypothetical protein|tara:strand:+ start:731 stop:1264 length:534 start_codon:yes stop_codon:yes gene_type:complete
MEKLKTVSIKGKQYVEVHERLRYFREKYPEYTLDTEIIEKTEDTITFKAIILNEQGRLIASGSAEERRGSSFINKTSYVENCETSAWGRALGNFGIGLDTSVASFDEVSNAITNQNTKEVKKETHVTLDLGQADMKKTLDWIATNKAMGLPGIVKALEQKYKITAKVKKEIANIINN